MRRVLLTGASGFIGHHCIEPLRARGFEVHAVSSRPQPPSSHVTWHQANLLAAGSAQALLAEVEPSHLLHLAWYVVPGRLITAPENLDWVTLSLELVHQFAAHGGKRLTVSGSAYEYDWTYGYCTENRTPAEPDTVYGSCKHALNLLVRASAAQSRLSAAWGRVFFIYGPREHPDRFVPSVSRSLLRREPARCSHGRQLRDYLHVEDVACALVALLDSAVEGTVNIASGQATTLAQMALTIGRLLQRVELVQLGAIPARPNDAPVVLGNNARLLTEVGWQQRFDLAAGLEHTVEWWAAQQSAEKTP
jgi:nucleoside-diphosphate-sugar epimerase